MSVWFKKKLGKTVIPENKDMGVVVKVEESDFDSPSTKQDPDKADIRYWIDLAGRFDGDYLIVKGWCVQEEQHVSVSVSSSDGTLAHLLKSRREQRNDVLSHLNLNNELLEPGFFKIYDIEHASGDLSITFKSQDSEITIPLEETGASQEQLQSAWNEFFKEAGGDAIEATATGSESVSVEPSDFVAESKIIEESDVEIIDLEQKIKEEQQRQLAAELAQNPIKHHIEKVGIYNNKILMVRGWCADIDTEDAVTVVASKDNKPLRLLKCIRRERRDVAVSFGLQGEDVSYGFLLLLELTSSQDREFKLTFANSAHTKDVELKQFDSMGKEELGQNLVDSNAFSSGSAKLFLMQVLGRSYIAECESQFRAIHDLKINLHIEAGFALDKGCFFRGWLDDFQCDLTAIFVTDGAKLSKNLLPDLVRKVRPDVSEAFDHLPASFESGFYCYSELWDYKEPLYLLFFTESGQIARFPLLLSAVEENEVTVTQHILQDVDPRSSRVNELYQQHISPALLSLWKHRTALPPLEDIKVYQFGTKAEQPICSIIVPLYGRYDFVLHQISQFEYDEDFKNVDLIYVVDDPRIEQATKIMCEDIAKMNDVSFRVVSAGRNLGFAGANNLGVLFADSEYLLLLNSDVIPSESGWLKRMLNQYQQTDNIGAMGVKLVYEDESIQHLGMKFVQNNEFGHLWLNDHQFKGFPEALVPKVGLEKCPTVTAACLLVEKQKYDAIGGFDTSYILGDFEDSDLCLKLLESGYDNYILGTEKLYHLERQSQSLVNQGDWKFKLTLFNGWQHTQRWDQLIQRLQA